MDWAILAAKYVLGYTSSDELSEIAVQGILEGIDVLPMSVLAGLSQPVMSEAGPLFEAALRQMGVDLPMEPTARRMMVLDVARRAVSGALTPSAAAAELAEYAQSHEEPGDSLWAFVGFDCELEYVFGEFDEGRMPEDRHSEAVSNLNARIVKACEEILSEGLGGPG